MPSDGTQVGAGTGDVIDDEYIAARGAKIQRIKIVTGALDTDGGDVTAANPFAVQDIGDATPGSAIPSSIGVVGGKRSDNSNVIPLLLDANGKILIGTLGQQTMANSVPVAIANDQTAVTIKKDVVTAITAAWTSGTTVNTAATITVSNEPTVIVSYNITSNTITGGVITFEVSDDGANWYGLMGARQNAYTSDLTYTLTGSTGAQLSWQFDVAGYTSFRVRLSTAATGTGTANFRITACGADTVPTMPVGQSNAGSLNNTPAGNVASGVADSGNPIKVGGKYNSTLPTLTNGQRGDLQMASTGEVLGKVGGYAVQVVANFARAANTTAYSANQVVTASAGGSITLSGCARLNAGSGVITQILLEDQHYTATPLQPVVYLFNAAPTSLADNATLALVTADLDKLVAVVTLTETYVTNAAADPNGNRIYIARGLSAAFVAGSSSTALYAYLVSAAAYTPISGETFRFNLSVLQN